MATLLPRADRFDPASLGYSRHRHCSTFQSLGMHSSPLAPSTDLPFEAAFRTNPATAMPAGQAFHAKGFTLLARILELHGLYLIVEIASIVLDAPEAFLRSQPRPANPSIR